jgi:hypothetical protein
MLEAHEDARKMLPLAAMTPEVLQHTLLHSPQPINVADVLNKLLPHLEPAQGAAIWEQFRLAGAGGGAAEAALNGGQGQAALLAPGAANPAHAGLSKQAFAANSSTCASCGETYHASFSPLLLCDFCPAAHHLHCLGLEWAELPEGEWACPR